ncbi:hypothetical protein [Streptomyces viridochromogenes]|uniref:Uncharacterized protein n=1 Tax=Streptomyces viridochromogenes Tue57 TaxID=1160705 RepID=L8PHW2_STRVR|nr:hypothetical protein [Streptomyces viridochromogenes]ELS56015.1 hypothetical protein STVIR_3012 [Streptomyces viridochromogenes Tue57]
MQTEMSRFEVTGAKDGEEPFEVEPIRDSTEAALAMGLGTSTRDDIDARTPVLIGHLQRLLAEELGADKDEIVRHQFQKAYTLLDLKNRPTEDAPTFTAYCFMREVASLTRRLLWIYVQRSGTGEA